MNLLSKTKILLLALTVVASVTLVPVASASVIGHMNFVNCANGGVNVTATSIDFVQPFAGGTGCIVTGANMMVSYTGGGPLVGGVTGTDNDLVFGGPPSQNLNFLSFTGNTNLHFNLTGVGPGVVNTICAASNNPNLPACSTVAGSPFILAPNANGTSVTFTVNGIATDSGPNTSTWTGAYTTQINGQTPAQIQSIINGGGSEFSTYSFDGDVNVQVVPEPLTMGLIGGGLIGLAIFGRRRIR